jgi:hypothetical protein
MTLRVERVCETGRSAMRHAKGTELLQNVLIYHTSDVRFCDSLQETVFVAWLEAADEVDCLAGNWNADCVKRNVPRHP